MNIKRLTTMAGLFAFMAIAFQPAQAVVVMTTVIKENDCSGYFNPDKGGFSACQIFGKDDVEYKISPVIAQFDGDLTADNDNTPTDKNSAYPSITGSEWTFSNLVSDGDDKNITGDWTYSPTGDDPGVRFWVAKAQDFTLFWEVADTAVATGGECDVADVFVGA